MRLLIMFFTKGIQALMEEVCELQRWLLKNKPHLVTFHESILVSLWTFQLIFVKQDKKDTFKRKADLCIFYHHKLPEFFIGLPFTNHFNAHYSSTFNYSHLPSPTLSQMTIQLLTNDLGLQTKYKYHIAVQGISALILMNWHLI